MTVTRHISPDHTVYCLSGTWSALSYRRMLGLSDNQLAAVMDAAAAVPVEKRDIYLRRIAAMLTMRGRHFSDGDVSDVAKLALTGLAQQPAV